MDETAAVEDEASGRAIFWALTAIILNAMLQTSITGFATTGPSFEGGLWPHRSSPFVCLCDALIELRIMFGNSGWRTIPGSEMNEELCEPRATGAIMKLAVFMLGVLPQAIKLFSMQGVPLSQALGAMFLVPSLISMIRSMRPSSQHEIPHFLEFGKQMTSSWAQDLAFAALSATHGLCLFGTWYWIYESAYIALSEDVYNGVDWVVGISTLLTGVYIIQHIAFMLAGVTPPIPRYPLAIFLLWTGYLGVPALLKAPEKRAKGALRVQAALSLLLGVGFVSYVVTWGVWRLVKRVVGEVPRRDAANLGETESLQHEVGTGGVAGGDMETSHDLQTEHANLSGETLVGHSSAADIVLERQPNRPSAPEQQDSASQMPQDSATSNAGEEGSTPEKKNDLSWPGHIIVWIACAIVLPPLALALYSGLWVTDDKADQEHTTRQGAVEEARPPSQRIRDKVEDFYRALTLRRTKIMVLMGIQWPIRLFLRILLLLTWRLILALLSLFAYTMTYYQRKVQENPVDVLVIAVGVVNFVTLAVVYLCLFDGEGTSSPEWNSILG
jgi:hypothetical protein